jgi:prolyl oligopeptidase
LTPDGSEPETVTRLYTVATGEALPDILERSDFGTTGWRADGKALYYLRFQDLAAGAPPTALYQNVRTYAHILGTPQSADRAVFGSGLSPEVTISENEFAAAIVDPSSNYVIGLIINGVQNEKRLYVTPKAAFDRGKPHWVKVADASDDVTDVSARGDDLYLVTHKNAPRFAIIKTSAAHPDIASATVVVPPSSRVVDSSKTASLTLSKSITTAARSARFRCRLPERSTTRAPTRNIPALPPSSKVGRSRRNGSPTTPRAVCSPTRISIRRRRSTTAQLPRTRWRCARVTA